MNAPAPVATALPPDRPETSPLQEESAIPLRRRLLYLYFRLWYFFEGVLYDLRLRRPPGSIPHAVKCRIVRRFANRYGTRTLVETGTYMGDMIAAMASSFDELYSIELSPAFYHKAVLRFARKPHVRVIYGDSGEKIAEILPRLNGPALFWLDAHYSGGSTARAALDTPIVQELRQILGIRSASHVVLIDDARAFIGCDGYPSIDELRALVMSERPDYRIELKEDIIRLLPGTP